MARIRVRCPRCGDAQDLPPDEIALVAAPHDHALPTAYEFTCRSCRYPAVCAADDRAIGVLVAAGVDPFPDVREEHPEDPPGGPPLTRDDLLDLHVLLAHDGWFERLRRTVGNQSAGAPPQR